MRCLLWRLYCRCSSLDSNNNPTDCSLNEMVLSLVLQTINQQVFLVLTHLLQMVVQIVMTMMLQDIQLLLKSVMEDLTIVSSFIRPFEGVTGDDCYYIQILLLVIVLTPMVIRVMRLE